MSEKSIIEVIPEIQHDLHEHLRSLKLGYTPEHYPALYRHTETKKEYLHLAGAIAWPGKIDPGYAVVIGARWDDIDQIIFECLEEAQDYVIENLLNKCVELRERYGFRKTCKLFQYWHGDITRFPALLSQFNNQKLRDADKRQEGIYLSPPIDFEKANCFEIYMRQLQRALTPDTEGKKILFLGNCNVLRTAIQNLPEDAAFRFTQDDSPAVFAAGSLIHAIIITAPWVSYFQHEAITYDDADESSDMNYQYW